MIYLFYLLSLGAVAGFIAGLLGVGGGLIIVPILAMIYASQGAADNIIMHLAVGTSLATIVFTSISSVWAHHQHGAVRWAEFFHLTPGIIIGAWFGAGIADILPTAGLRIFFGFFELFVAIQMSLGLKPKPHRILPGRPGMLGAGHVIGAVSSVVGIGGGSMTVPFLVWCNVSMREAVATSAACGLPIAIAGAIGYLVTGWGDIHLPDYSLGFIYLPALLGISSASIVFAPLGARMAHRLPARRLKQVFAMVLYILAGYMLFG